MKNQESKKLRKVIKTLINPYVIALSIPIAQILLGRKKGIQHLKQNKGLKTMQRN